MRLDNPEFAFNNRAQSREPVFVIRISFDEANTDIHYLTSHSVAGLTGNIINNTLKIVSSTSQSLNPDKALSTIGSIKFECLDDGLTELQREKLKSGAGLKDKVVALFIGDKTITWDKFELVNTQTISTGVSYKNNVYTFQCADVQRQMRKTIFEVKETSLSASLSAEATTIDVFYTSGFERVKQPSSESGITDAPGQKVGYLIHEDNGRKEIIRYTGKTSNSFTGCTRGVLGTKPISVEYSDGDSVDEAPKITEFVYLEMAAPKLAYALLTGSIYGEVGEFLPDHWHLGISTDYVKTSDFTNIGADLWDVSVNDSGLPAVVKGVEKTSGKKFIEEQLLLMMGAFMPVYSTGELGLRLMSNIAPNGGYDRLITTDQVASYGELRFDLKSVINQIQVSWNYVISKGEYTRQNILIDPDSISKHGESEVLELKMRTLETSRHSYTAIKSRFDSIRDSYAGPPIILKLELTPDQNDIEAGDILRVDLPHIQDFTQDEISLNRNFQVRKVDVNWVTGAVGVSLFASSQPAGAVPPQESTSAVPNAFYSSEGTQINATNFPGSVSSNGGVTTISADITLAGADSVGDSSCVYYCLEDMTINAGVVVTITKNVQIRVRGFLQNNGDIDGAANGMPGALGVSTLGDNSHSSNVGWQAYDYLSEWAPENIGNKGFIDGTCSPQTGGLLANRQFFHERTRFINEGSRPTAPVLNIEFDGFGLKGLPSNLQGTSGAGGGCLSRLNSWSNGTMNRTLVKPGSNGGASGAALVVLCRGFDHGANAKVDTSGGDADVPESGQDTNYSNPANVAAFAGAGVGGQPGAVYYLMDGQTSTPGTLDDSNSVAFTGDSPTQGDYTAADYRNSDKGYQTVWGAGSSNPIATSIYLAYPGPENLSVSAHRVQFVTGYEAPENDTSEYVESSPTFTLTAQANTPVTSIGDRSTIEVSVTPPVDDNYSYSAVDYKRSDKTVWIPANPASNESLIEVPSAGATFDVRVRPVSKSGVVSPSGEVKSVTVVDRNGRTNAELATVYPLAALTGFQVVGGGLVFTGLDCGVTWSNDNAELTYFNYYEIEVYDGATLLRTEQSVSPFYVYTYEKNRADYLAQNATVGVYLAVEIRVKTVSKYRNNLNELYATSAVALTFTATTTNHPQNLRFYSHADVYEQSGRWRRSYAVTSAVTAELLDNDGNSLPTSGVANGDRSSFLFTGITAGTATVTRTVAQFDWNGSAWEITQVSALGTTSNHPEFLLDGGVPSVRTNHNGNYNVVVYGENAGSNQNINWDNVNGPNVPADNADQTDYDDDRVNNNGATPFTLIKTANITVNGAKVAQNSAGSGWASIAYSVESYTNGAFVSCVIDSDRFMIGLDSNPEAATTYAQMDFLIYARDVSGTVWVFEDGSIVAAADQPAFAVGDTLSVAYDGVHVIYYHNGIEIHRSAAAPNLKLHLAASMDKTTAGFSSLQFGPFTSNNWGDMGGDDLPADNADVTNYGDDRVVNNLLDVSSWSAAAPDGSLPGFNMTGAAGQAKHVLGVGPRGTNQILWQGNHDTAAIGQDVGFTTDPVTIDSGKIYRLSCWVWESGQLADADFTYGVAPNGDVSNVQSGNPYSVGYGNIGSFQIPSLSKWFLAVWYVLPYNYQSGDGVEGQNGLYDPDTGEINPDTINTNNIRFTDINSSELGMFIASGGDNSVNLAKLANPRIDVVNGSEQSIETLLNMGRLSAPDAHIRAGNTYLLSGQAVPSPIVETELILDMRSELSNGFWETVGRTGSGASNIWPALDLLPATAKILIVDVTLESINNQNFVSGSLNVAMESPSNPTAKTSYNRVFSHYENLDSGSTIEDFRKTARIMIPLNDLSFWARQSVSATDAAVVDFTMYYRGFLTD